MTLPLPTACAAAIQVLLKWHIGLRDGTFWSSAGQPESTGENYDLIVVGGGISGLASARFFHHAAGKDSAGSHRRES